MDIREIHYDTENHIFIMKCDDFEYCLTMDATAFLFNSLVAFGEKFFEKNLSLSLILGYINGRRSEK